jgi:hypothetical protein
VLVVRSIGVALALVVVAASAARANGRIVINADLGIDMPVQGNVGLFCPYSDHGTKHRPVLNLDIAYRFIDRLAAGVHFGARHYPWEQCGGNIPGAYQTYRGLDTALELGVGAQGSISRFWLSSWLGFQDENEIVGPVGGRHLAYALAAGVDVYVHPSGHRIGVYLDLTNATSGSDDHVTSAADPDEMHLSAGIAYRYW